MGENLHAGALFTIEINRALQARLRGEPTSELDPDIEVPDFLPEEWEGPENDEG